MKNSKLSQLLAKLENMPIENDQNEFIVLDEKCEYIKSISGGMNSTCKNNTCLDGTNGTCSNGVCSGTNNRCGEL